MSEEEEARIKQAFMDNGLATAWNALGSVAGSARWLVEKSELDEKLKDKYRIELDECNRAISIIADKIMPKNASAGPSADLYKQFEKFGMGAAYVALAQSAEVSRQNAPIWEADGNPDQAALSKRNGEECEAAIKFISDRIGATP